MSIKITDATGFPIREEKLHFELEVHWEEMTKKEQKDMLKYVEFLPGSKGAEGVRNLTYELTLEYFNVVFPLGQLIQWADRGWILKCSTSELAYQRCLIQELLCKLEQIEKKYKEQQNE